MKNNIKEVLKEKGITQKELADKIGMTEVGVSKAINSGTSLVTIEKISRAIGVSREKLIGHNVFVAKYGSEKTPLTLGALKIPCFVLEDGTRVFSGRGMERIFTGDSKRGGWLKNFVKRDDIRPHLDNIENGLIEKFDNPIKFVIEEGKDNISAADGYEATLLIDMCSAILESNREGDFHDDVIVKSANIIIRAVAKVGIIALIDEATGYDKAKERAKDELQKFLSRMIAKESAEWVKTFPDTFFEDIYKMHNWTWGKTTKRPGVVGKWINDIIYERLGPKIKEELNAVNPRNENGNRARKHHQHLTRDGGLPELQRRLEAIHAIAVVSNYDWYKFMRNIDKAYPKDYSQYEIFDFDD